MYRERVKAAAWLLLAMLSTAFAEGVSGSDMVPFTHAWGLIVELPLYGLHLLVLGGVVFMLGRPTLPVLYAAGVLFGLYEAYITKVVWNPGWGPEGLRWAGVAWFQTAIVVVFWHPWMAFIVPLLAGELVLGGPGETWAGLPRPLARAVASPRRAAVAILTFAALCGFFQSINSPSPWRSLRSGAENFGAIAAVVWFLRRRLGSRRIALRAILPRGRALAVFAAVLALFYAVFGYGMLRERLPGWKPQAVVWAMYLATGLLLYGCLHAARARAPAPPRGPRFSWNGLAAFAAVLAGTSAALSLLPAMHAAPGYLAASAIELVAGAALAAYAVRSSIRGATAGS